MGYLIRSNRYSPVFLNEEICAKIKETIENFTLHRILNKFSMAELIFI